MEAAIVSRPARETRTTYLAVAIILGQAALLLGAGAIIPAVIAALVAVWGCYGVVPPTLAKLGLPWRLFLGALLVCLNVLLFADQALFSYRNLAALLVVVQACELLVPTSQSDRWRIVGLSVPTLLLLTPAAEIGQPIVYPAKEIVIIAVWALLNSMVEAPFNYASLRTRTIVLTVVIGFAAIGAWALQTVAVKYLPSLQAAIAGQLQVPASGIGIGRSFSWNTTLDSIANEQQHDPDRTALIVYCVSKPGYLRSAAFDTFTGARWSLRTEGRGRAAFQSLRPTTASKTLAPPPEGVDIVTPQSTFELNDVRSNSLIRVDVLADATRGNVYFLPLDTALIQGNGRQLLLGDHQVIRGGLDLRQPYTLWAAQHVAREPLTPQTSLRLKSIPTTVEPAITALLRYMPATNQPCSRKIAAVEAYFRKNYRYSLEGFDPPPNQDAFTHFLTNKPAAHCEYFATAAVMLLRKQGVPARYVTGFTVTESEPGGEYWVARNRNAHAWAEAYDGERGYWVTVEATPGITAPKEIGADLPQQEDSATPENNEAATDATAAATSSELFWRRMAAFAVVIAILLCAGGLIGGAWWLRRLRSRAPNESKSRIAAIRKVDALVARRSLRRESHETLHQFATRLSRHATDSDDWLHAAAVWYRGIAIDYFAGSPFRLSPVELSIQAKRQRGKPTAK